MLLVAEFCNGRQAKQKVIMSVFIPATLCYLRCGNEVLMIHRNKSLQDEHYGKYNGIGGKFAPEEAAHECAVREILEESGIKLNASDLKLNGIIFFPEFDAKLRHWHVYVFSAWLKEKPAKLPDCPEGTLQWVPVSSVQNLNLWPGDRLFLPQVFSSEEKFFMGKISYHQGQVVSHQFW